ncbi:PREDICTED: jun dimerization protein 2 isoform X4 [Myotis brandtii]|uniref:jun dimerization protein 2 isoform X3 n=1 Tax=Myotis brandtii TaxID=109478 RepID=UPI0007045FDD|nr:PREDICTED: jun dimerization protein 2 isoform X3 [Myotis brandtii]XP_014386671.1 PREDICTED: jun dimerization protein 2 isoform X4 [Myotis brandtii]
MLAPCSWRQGWRPSQLVVPAIYAAVFWNVGWRRPWRNWGKGWTATPPAMMPGQIPDPSVTAGSLPGLGPLTGLPSSALTAEELKYADIRNIGAMIAPLHFLEVKLGKRPQPVKSEESERLELMNAELKTQIEELKQERQQLILMLNRHRPTCIVRTDSVKTPDSEGNPLLEQLEKK